MDLNPVLNTLEEYKQLAADFPDPEHFRIGINLAWDKLDEYYQRLDETPIYYTAMALHPAYRWDWFDETWAHKPSWVEKAKEMVADVWLSDYAHLEVRTSSSRGDDEPPAKRPRFFNPFEKNSRLPNSKPAYAAIIVSDEYQAWQTDREASDGDVRDPIGYWITKQSRYPRLSRMALDFLTIQPMSAECERLFSAAGKMVSGLRTNLDAEIIAICQVLRSWYRAGHIKDLDPLLKSHLESKLDAGCVTLSEDELALAESKWLLEGENSASEVDDSSQQQQIEELVSTSESLMVKADNDTRWNSVYLMVHRALRLRDIIDVFCKLSLLDPKEEKRVSAEDVLSCEDWVVLAEIIEILQPYLTYTKHFEGRTPRFAEVLPTMYLLKDHLSEMRQRYSSNLIPAPYRAPRITLEEPVLDCIIVAAPTDGREREQQGGLQQDTGVSTWGRYSTMESTTSGEPSSPLYQAEISVQFEDKDLDPEPFELSDDGLHFIQHSIKYAMSKLDKYRNLMERSVVYWAAMILHPGYGIGFLQLRLPNQVDSILRDFRDYFDRHYAQGNQAPVSPDSPPAFHGSKLLLRTANFPKKARKEAPDEINLYLQMVPEEDFKEEQLLQWWLGRKTQFPPDLQTNKSYPNQIK
ncbi:hypothetical protein BFJ65_g14720 [Fusarium oxysporum f. sp. cepae]|uniref:HAT C-terminal dimerisation domain-containing protein n=1 Tax=Fusarium oxysporum f. sp. cepae TaxID=396571 RepID=A0A3L6N1P3_FUSOX|nr:hypothetical protein BFJ65_g14720 [Fusarium oxysporum f. sp. cepae]